jgi:hypothetical protein
LGTKSRRGLIVLNPGDDLRQVSVDNQSALSIVRSREVTAYSIEFSLNLLISGIVRDVRLRYLDNKFANSARRLLDGALDGLGGSLR